MDDWRISGQDRYLAGAMFQFRSYETPRPGWDHDHCDFCWSKFCAEKNGDCLNEGFVTLDGKHWVCRPCFEEFRNLFHFAVFDPSP